jgi:hypothetical protein
MARLPVSGAASYTPFRSKAELRNVLVELCPEGEFSQSDVDEIYWHLARIIGQWSAEQDRPDIAPLAKTLKVMGRQLEAMSGILRGHETGLRDRHDIEIVSQLASLLALDPEIGSRDQAHELIDRFRRDAAKLSHACLIAADDLKRQVGKSGRPPLDWHHDFAALLRAIAAKAGIKPSLHKDRISNERGGWLPDAALALETFLHPDMRSSGAEARGKRLDRSKSRLNKMNRQNPSRG